MARLSTARRECSVWNARVTSDGDKPAHSYRQHRHRCGAKPALLRGPYRRAISTSYIGHCHRQTRGCQARSGLRMRIRDKGEVQLAACRRPPLSIATCQVTLEDSGHVSLTARCEVDHVDDPIKTFKGDLSCKLRSSLFRWISVGHSARSRFAVTYLPAGKLKP